VFDEDVKKPLLLQACNKFVALLVTSCCDKVRDRLAMLFVNCWEQALRIHPDVGLTTAHKCPVAQREKIRPVRWSNQFIILHRHWTSQLRVAVPWHVPPNHAQLQRKTFTLYPFLYQSFFALRCPRTKNQNCLTQMIFLFDILQCWSWGLTKTSCWIKCLTKVTF
jgi:hypothetical protein